MKEQIDNYIKNEIKLRGSLIGVCILSQSSGEKLYEHMSCVRLHPASNMKLFTSAAALAVLGKDYTFPTEIRMTGTTVGATLKGNLYFVGKGDPTLVPSAIISLSKQLLSNGINKIEGDIIGDDTWYDKDRISPDLVWTDEQYYYGAQVSALTASPNEDYDTGSIIVEVTAANVIGDKPAYSIFPKTDIIEIENNAVTAEEASEDELVITRGYGSNVICINGNLMLGSVKRKEFMSVPDPSLYALNLFTRVLEKEGIIHRGASRLGNTPKDSQLIVSRNSIPLVELLIPLMKLSNNGHAEILVKEMGKKVDGEGSWKNGLAVVKREMVKLGINMETIQIKDGSGISHNNLIPANEITHLLYEVQKADWFPSFLNALPAAGEDDRMVGGTLRERMKGILVKAKTGTIEGVSTLSGYITTKNHNNLIFSIMINNLLNEEDGKLIEDEIVNIIDFFG
ncbi:D-alanyl-D-alanine carboxypeptidase/D-alanyl-D-alanine endopeptidase [Oceanobacillus chungangensis]|uniref:D-alanyl-D-alanine carboxypeptidase/D-alanyl-D-alanine-endopeptidase n=1 Tax=Oceanobacillus chungangensis TaxID=1229152 RepID=A0A3D8PRY0_9BACI|nr:D-alanyl-D-alanine carboxypeptidase/D-alanyl-D-alanine-endopeptidase [Oceanobacillus chungangensis]RDW18008.1 D-alanyl-D-alanine carboxypeptidase/D-alanyl-D-alanine-endopeptidase [Oceanobacillus chungangensis]